MGLKLALVIPGFRASGDDWCIPALTNLADELARFAEVHVYALRYPPFVGDYKVGQVYVHALGGGAFGGKRIKGASLLKLWRQTLFSLEREHGSAPFSAVIGIWATESGYLATQAAHRVRVPSLVHLAGGELVRIPAARYGNRGVGLPGMLVRRTLEAATLLTLPSSAIARALPAGVPREKTRMWALGVDTEMFAPLEGTRIRKDGVFTFVTAGSLIPVKDHEWLLRAMSRLCKDVSLPVKIRLRIAGSGSLRSKLEGLVEQLGIGENVEFLGEVAHDELPSVYRSADACVFSSWHEAQCMALLEAMACGLPWVGPLVGAISNLAEQGCPTGFAVRERTPEALAASMLQMASLTHSVRQTYSEQARTRILEDYDLHTQAMRLAALVAELLTQQASHS